jgi:hypothetical protein
MNLLDKTKTGWLSWERECFGIVSLSSLKEGLDSNLASGILSRDKANYIEIGDSTKQLISKKRKGWDCDDLLSRYFEL